MNPCLPALMLACALLLSGCTGGENDITPEPSPSATPVVQSAAERQFTLPYYPSASLHPITGDNRSNLIVSSLVYETLFVVDETFSAQPLLAQSYATEDGLTHIITLRQDVVFSDGTPLTAQDAAASLELARASTLYASRLSLITSVKAEEGRLVVTTSVAHGCLPLLLDIPVVQSGGGERPLGSGPYRFSITEEADLLVPNPHWDREEQLPFSRVSLYPITETDMLVSGFDSQEISMVSTDLTGTNALGFSGDYDIWDYPTSTLLYVGFNTRSGLCRDGVFRSALSAGLDRGSVVSGLLSRHAQAAALPVSPASRLYDQGLADEFAYSAIRMDRLLGEAGYTQGEDGLFYYGRGQVTLTMLVNSDNSYKLSIARYLAGQLTQAGVQVTLRELAWEDFTAALAKGEFDLYLGEVKLTADFDLTSLLASNGALNYGRWSDRETDTLLAAFRAADAQGRPAAAAALCRHVVQQAPIAPLSFKCHSVLTHWGTFSAPTVTQSTLFYQLSDWVMQGDA